MKTCCIHSNHVFCRLAPIALLLFPQAEVVMLHLHENVLYPFQSCLLSFGTHGFVVLLCCCFHKQRLSWSRATRYPGAFFLWELALVVHSYVVCLVMPPVSEFSSRQLLLLVVRGRRQAHKRAGRGRTKLYMVSSWGEHTAAH